MVERNLSVELRPKDFHEFIGSQKVVAQIRSQLANGRIPTAFLFSGPTGTGKTTTARIICNSLEGELVEVNASDDTGVDAARQLGEDSQRMPLMGKYRVIVMDEAHQLTKAAQNALLKYVEDAPPSTIWIFCTTDAGKIIPTLRGRCISYTLGGLAQEETALLVYRAINHLGKKGDAKLEEFIKKLVEEGITAPRAILNATECFVGGMDSLGAIYGTQDSPMAFEIAKALFKKDWQVVAPLLAKVSPDEAMTVRHVCVGYLKSVLLKNGSPFAARAIIKLTEDIQFESSLALSNLCATIYLICKENS